MYINQLYRLLHKKYYVNTHLQNTKQKKIRKKQRREECGTQQNRIRKIQRREECGFIQYNMNCNIATCKTFTKRFTMNVHQNISIIGMHVCQLIGSQAFHLQANQTPPVMPTLHHLTTQNHITKQVDLNSSHVRESSHLCICCSRTKVQTSDTKRTLLLLGIMMFQAKPFFSEKYYYI